MKLEYFILGLLQTRPFTGYDLKKFLDTEGRFIRRRTPLSQIYNTLSRMTDAGWLQFKVEPQEGKPDRKVYSLTAAGKTYLMDWLTATHEPSFRFQERTLMGKIAFAYHVDNAIILQHLKTELAYRKKQISQFRNRDRSFQIGPDSHINPEKVQAVADLLHDYGAGAIDHYVAWLEEAIAFFEKETPKTTES